jgi:propanol-preferring alcohol dehydrogenase
VDLVFKDMKAAILSAPRAAPGASLQLAEVPRPQLEAGHILLRMVACGVCRTDLQIVEGDLPQVKQQLIPGHQIVGEVIEGATAELPLGARVGVSWMGGVDGDCWYCRHGSENLCDQPTFTGYTVNGGYAEYALARADFVFPLPAGLDDVHVAPLLCAGIIGFRSLRVAGVEPGERVGLFGFGSSASLAIAIRNRGNARSTWPPEAGPIVSWLLLSARLGWARKTTRRPCNSTARSLLLPAARW